jgi:hypothetical protein
MRSTLVLAAEFAGHASSVRFERSYHQLEFWAELGPDAGRTGLRQTTMARLKPLRSALRLSWLLLELSRFRSGAASVPRQRCCLEFDRTGHSRTGKRDLAGVYRRGAQPTISPALLITFRRSRYKADPGGVSVLMSVIVPFRSLGRHTLSLHT